MDILPEIITLLAIITFYSALMQVFANISNPSGIFSIKELLLKYHNLACLHIFQVIKF